MKLMQNQDLQLKQGDIQFYDNYIPSLEDGDYTVTVSQRVNPKKTTIDETYLATQNFSVQGPRYNLPLEDVFSVFPPANAAGIFDQFMPHVVLTKPELPWERDIFNTGDSSRQLPWLALLLFVEGEEKMLYPPNVDSWNPNPVMAATIPAAKLYESHAQDSTLWPELKRETHDTDDYLQNTPCNIIDIDPQAFTTFFSNPDDLRFLAHARQVDPSAKDEEVLKVSGDGWYSVITGKRLPDAPPAGSSGPGRRNIVHLVSLEGFQKYVGQALPEGTKRIRMISFKSWTFTCLAEQGNSFAEIMQGLLKSGPEQPKSTAWGLPVEAPISAGQDNSADDYAYRTIRNGFVPLRYQTRLGEQSFAWYRGPFAPIPVKNFISAIQQDPKDPANWEPFDTASAALIYDQTYGLFNVSYAVAWETGRLLALSDKKFGRELLDWQQNGQRMIDLVMERKHQLSVMQNLDPENNAPLTAKSWPELIKTHACTGDFIKNLVGRFAVEFNSRFDNAVFQSNESNGPALSYPDLASPVPSSDNITNLLNETPVRDAVRESGDRDIRDIANWLADLYLLKGVPFENLIPHPGLLPPESIRFFYLDSNWLDCLVEGALSIGIQSSRDQCYQDLMKDLIRNNTTSTVQKVRDNLLGSQAGQQSDGNPLPFDQEKLSGMLLRSTVVSGWPGLEIHAYARFTTDPSGLVRPDLTSEIKMLRFTRLSEDVSLCIWPLIPALVTIDEPREGVAFGFEDPPQGEGYYLYLRSLDRASDKYGMPLGDTVKIDGHNFIDQNRCLKINGSEGLLSQIQTLSHSGPVLVGDFAIEMIKVPEQAVFAVPSASGKESQ